MIPPDFNFVFRTESYPSVTISAALGIGLILCYYRPYMGFLFSLFLVCIGDPHRLHVTRTQFLGPYLNLEDACILIALTACILDIHQKHKDFRLPKTVFYLGLCIAYGAVMSFDKFGPSYETLRAARWAIQLPLGFWLAANMIDSRKRARHLFITLFIGAVVLAAEHLGLTLIFTPDGAKNMELFHYVRTVTFASNGMIPAFLAMLLFYHCDTPRYTIPLILVKIILVISLLLAQTRSFIIATAAAAFVIYIVRQIQEKRFNLAPLLMIVVVILGANYCIQYFMPDVDAVGYLFHRIAGTFSPNPDVAMTRTRINQFYVEMDHWKNGNPILGQGLFFFQDISNDANDNTFIAFGHLGYVTYCSQLGLFGLFCFGLYLPFRVLKDAYDLWMTDSEDKLQSFGMLGFATMLYFVFQFTMSSSFLMPWYFIPGIVFGGIWAIRYPCQEFVDPIFEYDSFLGNHHE